MWTFIDIIWHNPRVVGANPHPLADISGCIVPVSSPALRDNHRKYPSWYHHHRDRRRRTRTQAAGRYLARIWRDILARLAQLVEDEAQGAADRLRSSRRPLLAPGLQRRAPPQHAFSTQPKSA